MKSGNYRITRKGGIGLRRRRKPLHWSERFPAGVRPEVADMPPDATQEPQDEGEGRGATEPRPEPETAPSARKRRPPPRNYDDLKESPDDGRD